jgi:hypothetical protein
MAKKRPLRIKSPKPNDSLMLFLNARGFDFITRIVDQHQGNKSLLLWPKLANESFALELYLKCLHRIRRRKVWGHDIKKLYDQLSVVDRKKISQYLLDIVRGHADYLLMYSKGVPFDAESVAMRASKMFARARYWSDLDLPDPDDKGFVTNAGIGNFADAIRKLILELRPDYDDQVKNFRFKLPGHGTLLS